MSRAGVGRDTFDTHDTDFLFQRCGGSPDSVGVPTLLEFFDVFSSGTTGRSESGRFQWRLRSRSARSTWRRCADHQKQQEEP
jgi:hypothetical protein